MKIEVVKQGKIKAEIDFELSWQEFEAYYKKALGQINQTLSLDGFRPGKAPLETVEQRAGSHKILEEAAELALREIYPDIVRKNDLEVVGPPQVEILKLAKGNEFQVKIKIDILPQIDLPDYQKIVAKVERKKAIVNDEEVEETMKWIQKSRANMEPIESGATKGNWVEIEYQSPQIENSKMLDDSFILGEAKLILGFEKEIEGMKAGEEKEFKVVFPNDYFNKEMASKEASFKLKVKAVKKMDLPELTDEFAKTIGNFETVEGLKENIKEGLGLEKNTHYKEEWKDSILNSIIQEMKIDLPEVLALSEKERIIEGLRHEAEHLKISFEDYLKQIKKTFEELEKEAQEKAKDQIKKYLILREIGKKEGIEVLEQDLEQEINRILASYPQLDPKKIDKEGLKGVLYNNKVFEKLYASYSNNN